MIQKLLEELREADSQEQKAELLGAVRYLRKLKVGSIVSAPDTKEGVVVRIKAGRYMVCCCATQRRDEFTAEQLGVIG